MKEISLKTKQELREIEQIGNTNLLKSFSFGIRFITILFFFFVQLEIFSYISNNIGSFRLDLFMCLMITTNIIGYILIMKDILPKENKLKQLRLGIETREGLTIREIRKSLREK